MGLIAKILTTIALMAMFVLAAACIIVFVILVCGDPDEGMYNETDNNQNR